MLTNADITVYHRVYDASSRTDTWERAYVSEAWWFSQNQSSVTSDGLKNADVYTVRIPDTSTVISKDDYIVKGDCSIEMQTVRDLSGQDFCKVTSVNYNTFGDSPHIKVVGC